MPDVVDIDWLFIAFFFGFTAGAGFVFWLLKRDHQSTVIWRVEQPDGSYKDVPMLVSDQPVIVKVMTKDRKSVDAASLDSQAVWLDESPPK